MIAKAILGVVCAFGAAYLLIVGLILLLTPTTSWIATGVHLGGGAIASYLAHRLAPPAPSLEDEDDYPGDEWP